MRLLSGVTFVICIQAWSPDPASAFVGNLVPNGGKRSKLHVAVRPSASDFSFVGDFDTRSFLMSKEQLNPIAVFGKGDSEKIVNVFGVWCFIAAVITCPIWFIAMKLVYLMANDENRAKFDTTGKIWSKAYLYLINSYPTVSGNVERLKEGNDLGACLFVSNHASWLDIPVLCTVLDPVFKFIAKGELSKVPCIGNQLKGVSKEDAAYALPIHVISTCVACVELMY